MVESKGVSGSGWGMENTIMSRTIAILLKALGLLSSVAVLELAHKKAHSIIWYHKYILFYYH